MSNLGSEFVRVGIKDRYTAFKDRYVVQQRRKHEYAINRYYAHIIDPFITKLAYDLRLSPNVVTIIAGGMGISAGICFILKLWWLGALLLQLHHFLDGADGNLARLLNKCSEFGAKLDRYVDQCVRLVLFVALAVSVDVALWAKVALPISIYLDLWIVHAFILPFSRKYSLVRAKWKSWFLNKGIIPGFDIFTIYFIVSLMALIGNLEFGVYLIIIMKTLDWLYRVWECWKSRLFHLRGDSH